MNIHGAVILLISLTLGSLVWAEDIDPEQFMQPARATNFAEQKLLARIKAHRHNDFADAAVIQRKLAQYYAERGDEPSALLCEQRARAAEQARASMARNPEKVRKASETLTQPVPSDASSANNSQKGLVSNPSGWSGRYFGMVNKTLHKWDFNPDGTFSHQIIASGSGTSVRNQEKGRFAITGTMLELTIEKHVTAYATPGLEARGRQTAFLGGGKENTSETRRMKIEILGANGEKGIVLDGMALKVRSWY